MSGSGARLPFTSLSSFVATGTGPGAVHDLECVLADHTLVLSMTGPGNPTVILEGSHDGIHWVGLVSMTIDSSHNKADTAGLNILVRYVRANLTTGNGAETAASLVTATIASA